jgi:hypothetical protein
VNALQAELSTFPAFLAQALDAAGDPGARHRPAPERWSLCEVLWHLADMGRENLQRAGPEAIWQAMAEHDERHRRQILRAKD